MNSQLRKLLILFVLWKLDCLVVAVDMEEVKNMVKYINSLKTSWTARVHPPELLEKIEQNLISESRFLSNESTLPIKKYTRKRYIPRDFDARNKWPHCKNIIGNVRDQEACGSCWAVQTTAMLSDRTCIGSRGSKQVLLSAEDLMTCCKCGGNERNSCAGGDADKALRFWKDEGIVTGGGYLSKEGCKPYSYEAAHRIHIPCKKKCTNKQYRKKYFKDKHKGITTYRLPSGNERQIQIEMLLNGPVIAHIAVYSDLHDYKEGIYEHKKGTYRASHILKMIGWGVENGMKYWLCINSWGPGWALMGGYIKIKRGDNHCGIESLIRAGRTVRRTPRREREAQASTSNKKCFFIPSITNILIFILILLHFVPID